MLFEFSIVRKYLIPKRHQLSLSLIAFMSIAVISLVVWLILVFLSVTDGIEKTWLKKLTSFNAPIQITPTDAYYQSYYYQIDGISNESNFNYKSIREKAAAALTDPYNLEEDLPIPNHWPEKELHIDGSTKDFVKLAFASIQKTHPDLIVQDYEVSGALLKLCMIRSQNSSSGSQENPTQSYLTQASYINSFSDKNPYLNHLIEPPQIEDLNHLFYLVQLTPGNVCIDQPDQISKGSFDYFQKRLRALIENIDIKRIKSSNQKISSLAPLLPEGKTFNVLAYQKQGKIAYLMFNEAERKRSHYFEKGTLRRKNETLIYTSINGKTTTLDFTTPLFSEKPLSMNAQLQKTDLSKVKALNDLKFDVYFSLQGHNLLGTIPWENIEIEEAELYTSFEDVPDHEPPWPYKVKNLALLPQGNDGSATVLLPKSFQTNHVKIGDTGYFSYNAPTTTTAAQEQRLPVQVAGFYDPGVMGIGVRMILTQFDLVHTINTSSQAHLFDGNMMNGIQVWFEDLSKTDEIQRKLTKSFDEAGILPYWKIIPYYQYEFARDLLQQFQSDKYLFTLIGIIILIVACSNIISLLVILVNDKKKDIAILSALGASKKSIAWIFTLCGGMMGCLGTLIGTGAALLTLSSIDRVVEFLSFLQGHEAFNTVFYGKSLPNQLSERALLFILIATPLISFFAGLIPALKACKVHPSKILRSE